MRCEDTLRYAEDVLVLLEVETTGGLVVKSYAVFENSVTAMRPADTTCSSSISGFDIAIIFGTSLGRYLLPDGVGSVYFGHCQYMLIVFLAVCTIIRRVLRRPATLFFTAVVRDEGRALYRGLKPLEGGVTLI